MIEREDIAQLKEVFVTRQECNLQMDGISSKLADDKARLAVSESQLALITKLLYAIGTGILALIIGSLWNLIAN